MPIGTILMIVVLIGAILVLAIGLRPPPLCPRTIAETVA